MKAFLLSSAYLLELKNAISHAKTEAQLYNTIVNAPFNTVAKGMPLGLSIVVFLLVDKTTDSVERVALADTESAKGALEFSVKKFHEIKIPLSNNRNAIVTAIKTGEYQVVSDWQYLFTPALTAEEARFNQAGAGIATSVVYPLLNARDGGAIIFSYVLEAENITKQYHGFMQQYVEIASNRLQS